MRSPVNALQNGTCRAQAFSPLVRDGSVWLVAYAERTTQVIALSPSTLTQQRSPIPFAIEQFPVGLAGGSDALWTVSPAVGALWRIDPRTNRATRFAELGHHPIAVAAGADAVWVAVRKEPLN